MSWGHSQPPPAAPRQGGTGPHLPSHLPKAPMIQSRRESTAGEPALASGPYFKGSQANGIKVKQCSSAEQVCISLCRFSPPVHYQGLHLVTPHCTEIPIPSCTSSSVYSLCQVAPMHLSAWTRAYSAVHARVAEHP